MMWWQWLPLWSSGPSTHPQNVDRLFVGLLVTSILVLALLFFLLLTFAIRYRAGSAADRDHRTKKSWHWELGWTTATLLAFVALFAWGAKLFLEIYATADDSLPIYVVAKQWMWKVQHPGGQREIDQLHVPLGQPVRLVMTSQDVIHSFYVPAFRVKQDVLPDRYTQLWFTATQTGTFDLFCAEFCGTDHSRMRGRVIVLTPADYAQWLHAHAGIGLAAQGKALFRRLGCSGCHDPQAGVHAPDLDNLYGSTVPLSDGSQILADERYLHDSIMLPKKEVAAGYVPIMPSYENRIGEDDVLALVAYLKSRSTHPESIHDGERR